MMRFTRSTKLAVLCAFVSAACVSMTFGQAPVPATTPPKPPRPIATIEAELKAADDQYKQAVPYAKRLGEAKFRQDNAAALVPLLKKMAGLLEEAATGHDVAGAARSRLQCLSMAVALGDAEAEKLLGEVAAGKSEQDALDAKCGLTLGKWVKASGDAAAQQKILDEIAAPAKEMAKTLGQLIAEREADKASHVGKKVDAQETKKDAQLDAEIEKLTKKQESYSDTLMVMAQLGPASTEMTMKVNAIVRGLAGDGAKMAATRLEGEQQQRNWIGRPINLAGRTTLGTRFNVADWRGKVVLIHFWATWSGPSRDSMAKLKKVYAAYHDKGFEIVGVCSDAADDRVMAFVRSQGIAWPQLRDQTQSEEDNQHPQARRYLVETLPTMFLVDRKGNLRFIDGDELTEEKVQKLMEEPLPAVSAPKK